MLKSGDTLYKAETEDLFDPTFWDGVTTIERGAFAFVDFSKLKDATLTIPEGVEFIASNAFSDCRGLKKVILPNSLKEIGLEAFSFNRTLEEVVLPNTQFEMKNFAFSNCYNLTKINLPDSMQEIPLGTFDRCAALEDIKIPVNTKRIEKGAFKSCYSLENIKIPANVENICTKAFEDCVRLENISFSKDSNLLSIGDSSFLNCKSLKILDLPKKVESIGEGAFAFCSSLEHFVVPEDVKSIGAACFQKSGLKSVVLNEKLKDIAPMTFFECENLQSIQNIDNIESIGDTAFFDCNLKKIVIPQSVKNVGHNAFIVGTNTEYIEILGEDTQFESGWINVKSYDSLKNMKINFNNPNYANIISSSLFLAFNCNTSPTQDNHYYLAKDKSFAYISSEPRDDLKDNTYELADRGGFDNDLYNPLIDLNARNNLVDISNLKEQGKVKFIPQNYVLITFPNSQIGKFFENKNHLKWQSLVKTLHLEDLNFVEKVNSLSDLLKIYYAIGGFPENTAVRDEAYDYILKYVATVDADNPAPQDIGSEIHNRFSKLILSGEYNPKFAEFFKKYYKDNKDFLVYGVASEFGENQTNDYLCRAHNLFNNICADYPYYSVNGNSSRGVFTPEFVAQICSAIKYDNVNQDNIALANMCARYGYNQQTFNNAQKILKTARNIKDQAVISAKPDSDENRVKYRVLEKDDIYGFFIGERTNCCQRLGDAGEDCVRDGYENPNSGFVVFEQDIYDQNDKPTGKKQIVGQAYVWYDPNTKTVCYDNIEIPHAVNRILKKTNHRVGEITATEMQSCINRSAKAIMETMNSKGIPVIQVTTGQGFNDAQDMFSGNAELSKGDQNFPANKNVSYSDAGYKQYVIDTYNNITNKYTQNISDNISQANQLVDQSQNDIEQHM